MPESPRFPPTSAHPPAARRPTPRRVDLVAFPGVQLLDVAGPVQVFATANDLAAAAGGRAPYHLRLVAPSPGPVQSSSGIALVAVPLGSPRAMVDTLIVAGGRGVAAAAGDKRLVQWIAARSGRARRVASVCTGAFLLGAAGLIAGRRVVTHWDYCARLADRFPDAHVEADPIFIRDGKIWSSAGICAGIDLALALVEEDLGRAAALAVARHLVVFLKRAGGQAQFSAALAMQDAEEPFAELHAWASAHPDADLSIGALAKRAGMSERSFLRHYRARLGVTPARAIERLRVEAARHWLVETSWPTKRIAARAGFGSEETMRRSFQRQISATPAAYRERFRAPEPRNGE